MTPGDPILFNYPVHNTGGHYDPTTGIYTVPIDGIYQFIVRIYTNADATIGVILIVDGDEVSKIVLIQFFPDEHCS